MDRFKAHAAIVASVLMVSAPAAAVAANTPPVQSEVQSLTSRLMAALQAVSGRGLSGDPLAKAYQGALESEVVASGYQPAAVIAALDAVHAADGAQRTALDLVKARIRKASSEVLRPMAFGGVLSGFPGDGSSSSSSGGGSDYHRP